MLNLDWKKRPLLTAAMVLAVLGVLLFIGSFFVQVTPNLCEYTPDGQEKDCAQHHLGPYALLLAVFTMDAHNGAIIGIATLGLVYVTYLLVKLGKEQARITHAQIRASIAAESPMLTDGPAPPGAIPQSQTGCPISMITIQNTGDTTAHEVRHYGALTFAQIALDGRVLGNALNYPADMEAIPATTIAKNGKTILSRNLGRTLTAPEIGQLGAQPPRHAIVLFGRVTYNDAFGNSHRTDYCLGYAGAYPPPDNFIWTFMTNGNYSD